MRRPFGGHIFVISIYIYIYLDLITSWTSLFSFYRMMILRSTTGPYGRPMIEVAYGENIFSLHRGCMRVDSSGRVVGVSTCCRPYQTYSGQHQCGLNIYYFLDFSYYKNLYVLRFQIYTCRQCNTKTLVVSDLVLARRGSENDFDHPLVLKKIK